MLGESPVVTVHIPPQLRQYAGGNAEIMASGETVGEILEAVAREYPGLRSRLVRNDGTLMPDLTVYLGASSVDELHGLATPVAMEELVSIVPTGSLPAPSAARQGRSGQAGPLDGVEHVLDDQAKLGVAGDLQFAVEEQGVGVFLTGQQLQVGRQVGGKGEVGLAPGPENRAEHAISIGV